MKNFLVWIVLISTAALGVAVAQPGGDSYVAVGHHPQVARCIIIQASSLT